MIINQRVTIMKKVLLLFMILLCSLTSAQALDLSAEGVSAFKPTNNVIKLSYGPGLFLKSYDFTYGQHKDALLSLDLSVDYAHTFNKGFGFAVNFIHSHISAIDGNDIYVGPSFYYGSPVDSYWYLDASLGLGYAHNNYTEHKNGVGLFGHAGIHYRIVKHWSVGAELRLLDCFYEKPNGWKQHDENGLGIFSNWRMALAFGVQYYF